MGRSVPETVCIDGIESIGPGGSSEERVYKIELITPMYGGGVVAGVVDKEMPVRTTSIRGHLRFWWRLLYGLKMPLSEMRQREMGIFGGIGKNTKSSSKIGVRVFNVSMRELKAVSSLNPTEKGGLRVVFQDGYPQYALFPFQGEPPRGKKAKVDPAEAAFGLSFHLQISCPVSFCATKEFQEIEGALRAWVNFGGLGARTRRGCGSLYCPELAPEKVNEVGNLLTRAPGIESLVIGSEDGDTLGTWSKMVDLMKQFRQGVGIGRNKGDKMPGRSRWPEPDTIRRRVEAHLERHAPTMQVEGFPRARFGMPIIFHFKDSDFGGKSKPDMEPIDTCLRPESSSRMASPVLLSPVKLKNGKVIPVIIFLKTGPLSSLLLERSDKKGTYPISVEQIVNPKFASYDKSPMGKPEKCSSKEKRSSKGDALEAFRAYLKERDYKEVIL